MRKLNTKDFARALYEVTKDLHGKDLHQVIENFVQLLARKQILKKSDRIITEFITYAKRQEGIQEIEITSARELPEATLNKVKKAFAEKVESVEKVDESLIGGFVVRSENRIFDGSLRTQLVRLKQFIG